MTDGFEEIEALATFDILKRGGVDVLLVSLTSDRIVVGKHGVSVNVNYMYSDINFDVARMLILPGGSTKINDHDGLKREIVKFAENGGKIAAICAAPMVLGGLGLLSGKKATCYPGFEKYLDGAKMTDEAVVVDENITTARAAGCSIEFALELLSQLRGKEVADEVAQKISFIIKSNS